MPNTKKNPRKNIIPHKASDHDERGEKLASDKPWMEQERQQDEAMLSERHAKAFQKDGVPLTDEDWEKEEALDDAIPDHLDKAVDDSLEALAEKEMNEDSEEEE